jgi:hypothetical protein
MVLFGNDPRAIVPRGGWSALRKELSRVHAEMRPVVERELAAALAGLLDVELANAVRQPVEHRADLDGATGVLLLRNGDGDELGPHWRSPP